MGDPAVNKTAYVYIDDDGDITMRLVTKKMTTSGITTHLYDYYYYENGDYEEAELISSENSKWIYEFPLPNDNDKYYKCKVDPRVDVMGSDPVKSRLKVDWDSLDEVDEDDWDDLEGDTDDDDDDSSSSSYTSSSNRELTSAETGIRVSGNVGGPGIVLEASRYESGTPFDMANTALAGRVNRFMFYDVNLRSGTSYVQPNGSVLLRIPIPAEYDRNKLILYRVNDDGTVQEISGTVNGSFYEANVDHFSYYVLAESDQVRTAAAAAASAQSGGSSTRTTSAGSSTTRVRTSGGGSTALASADMGGSRLTGKALVAGRVVPYTGDPMPVKELAVLAGLAALAALGMSLPDGMRRRAAKRSQGGFGR